MAPMKSDYNKHLVTLTVIKLSGFHCWTTISVKTVLLWKKLENKIEHRNEEFAVVYGFTSVKDAYCDQVNFII